MRSTILLLCGAVSLTAVGCSRDSDSQRASAQKGMIYPQGIPSSTPAAPPENDAQRFVAPGALASPGEASSTVTAGNVPTGENRPSTATTVRTPPTPTVASPPREDGARIAEAPVHATKTAQGWVLEVRHTLADHSGWEIRFCDPAHSDQCTQPVSLCEARDSSGCYPRFPLISAQLEPNSQTVAHTRFLLCGRLLPGIPENYRLELSLNAANSSFIAAQPFSQAVVLPSQDICASPAN